MPQRKWTPEQRKAASDRAKARMADSPTVFGQKVAVAEPESDGDDAISQLMATLAAVQSKKLKQTDALKQLGGILDQLDPAKNADLLDDPTIAAFVERVTTQRVAQAEKLGLPPGTQVGTGLGQDGVPWHYTDLPKYCRRRLAGHEQDAVTTEENSELDLVTFIPNQTTSVTWNGLTCHFHADEPLTTYKPFYDVWMESKRLGRIGDQHKAYMFGSSDQIPAELAQGDQAVATARVRAYMAMGSEPGRGRITVGYPGDAMFGLRENPTGGEAQSGEVPA
jgi:hypothetical protein